MVCTRTTMVRLKLRNPSIGRSHLKTNDVLSLQAVCLPSVTNACDARQTVPETLRGFTSKLRYPRKWLFRCTQIMSQSVRSFCVVKHTSGGLSTTPPPHPPIFEGRGFPRAPTGTKAPFAAISRCILPSQSRRFVPCTRHNRTDGTRATPTRGGDASNGGVGEPEGYEEKQKRKRASEKSGRCGTEKLKIGTWESWEDGVHGLSYSLLPSHEHNSPTLSMRKAHRSPVWMVVFARKSSLQ